METLRTRGAMGFESGKENPEQRSEMGENHFPGRVALWQVIREGNKVEWWAELTTKGLPKIKPSSHLVARKSSGPWEGGKPSLH